MKPAPFRYLAPRSLDEALAQLAEHGADAKPLAGGQSLVPAMNFRLGQPAVLVDLNRIGGLATVAPTEGGGLRIGAMTRQGALERDPLVGRLAPLLADALPHVAHPQIRGRGTAGGSLAHADPAAELPAVMLALEARLRLQSRAAERWVAAGDFFVGLFATALGPGELLVEVALPPFPAGAGSAFAEVARRHGDYALVGVAAVVELGEDGRCRKARIALLSVGEGPVLAGRAMAMLVDQPLGDGLIRAAAETAAREDIDPPGDIHASSDYRRHLAAVLTRRALAAACGRVRPRPDS